MTGPRILHSGDTALSVDFGNVIDLGINRRVHALDRRLRADPFPGVTETVPTYRALMVHLDPVSVDIDALIAHIRRLCAQTEIEAGTPRRWRLPVAYGGEHGEDLADLAAFCGMSTDDFIEAHAAPVYTVMMIGFMPGFSYLGGLDPRLARPRRDTPRPRIPASSVSIGGAQSAIGTVEGPSGWHLIGRTPALPFRPGRDPVFLFDAGDEILCHPVSDREWRQLAARAADGEAVAERIA